MLEASFPLLAAWVNTAFLGLAGLANWFDGRPVRALYESWNIPASSYRTIGLIEIVAATFIAVPHLRAWGIVLAAPIVFSTVVMLLYHRHYGYALGVIALLAGLGAATLAIPTYDYVDYAAL
jgi:hypothetical protein